jgi:hypothetical protein
MIRLTTSRMPVLNLELLHSTPHPANGPFLSLGTQREHFKGSASLLATTLPSHECPDVGFSLAREARDSSRVFDRDGDLFSHFQLR